jgi:predicted amidohydrolase
MHFRSLFAAILSLGAATAATLPLNHSGFQAGADGRPAGWKVWSPRPEIAPRGYIDPVHYRRQTGSLALSGNSNPAVFGGWECQVDGVEPGKWYRLTAYYRAEGVRYEPLQVVPRLDWARAGGKRAGQPEYGWRTSVDGAWKRIVMEVPAPENAASVKIQLLLQNAPAATVWWDEISLNEIAAPAPRPVKVASVNFRPRKAASAQDSVRQFVETVQRNVEKGADVILLPEGITIVSTGKSYAEVAEPVPGPTTERLAGLAREKNSYVVAGIYEREGLALYNTAVLLDRSGRLAGKYRKVYLPREELEGGLTPGSGYPVFDTDFGRIGLMICWDVQYADPARGLALNGAELLLVPIWGGNEALVRARAIENQVFIASSGYGYPTQILDPNGELLAVAREQGAVALATLDLSRRYADQWLGNMRGRFMKELRLDVKVEHPVK